jgi:hypothetical protein
MKTPSTYFQQTTTPRPGSEDAVSNDAVVTSSLLVKHFSLYPPLVKLSTAQFLHHTSFQLLVKANLCQALSYISGQTQVDSNTESIKKDVNLPRHEKSNPNLM